jgi:hypothetical protein
VDFSIGDPYDSSMRQRRGTTEAPPLPGLDPDPGATTPKSRLGRRYDPAWNDWNTPRRWPGILLSCVIVLGFLSIVIWHLRPHSTVHHPKVVLPSNLKVLPLYVLPVKGSRAVTFTGMHDMNGLHFVSDGGLLILHAQCTCEYNFVVTISNKSLVPIAVPVNDVGHVNSVLNTTVPKGPIVLSVRGQGHWNIQLLQPVATTPLIRTPFATATSANEVMAGTDVVGPFSAANKYLTFTFLSLSNGSVDVHVLSEQGFGFQTPFAGRIALSASKVLSSLPNPYFLEIDATGFWNLDVSRAPKS